MNFYRIFGYIGVVLGLLRFFEYYFLGDIHGGYALAWATHAFISGVALLWLTRKDSKRPIN